MTSFCSMALEKETRASFISEYSTTDPHPGSSHEVFLPNKAEAVASPLLSHPPSCPWLLSPVCPQAALACKAKHLLAQSCHLQAICVTLPGQARCLSSGSHCRLSRVLSGTSRLPKNCLVCLSLWAWWLLASRYQLKLWNKALPRTIAAAQLWQQVLR